MEQAADEAEQEARDYLSSLLNKYLRVTATDGRLFWGLFKCIDPVSLPFPITIRSNHGYPFGYLRLLGATYLPVSLLHH